MNPLVPTVRDWFVAILTILVLSFVSHIPAVGSVVKFILGL
jgi:hypothetical protein